MVFDQAVAASSWTKPSVASLFTSLLPREHGCVHFFTPLGPGLVTLAERLRARGYATGAVVANPHVGAKNMQFDQGFDQFEADASLRTDQIRVAAAGVRARSLPFLVPNEEELAEEVADPFSPPPSTTTGVSLWLAAPRSGHIASLDEETSESLKALGYLR